MPNDDKPKLGWGAAFSYSLRQFSDTKIRILCILALIFGAISVCAAVLYGIINHIPTLDIVVFLVFIVIMVIFICVGLMGVILFFGVLYSLVNARKLKDMAVLEGEIMTEDECRAAMEETLQSVDDYTELVTAAKTGNEEARNAFLADDTKITKLQENILAITGAKFSDEEIRRYFSEWYLSKNEVVMPADSTLQK